MKKQEKKGILVVFVLIIVMAIVFGIGIYKDNKLKMQNKELANIIMEEEKDKIKTINFFGDSITEEGKYINSVMEITDAIDYVNNGIGSTSFAVATESNQWTWETSDRNYTKAFCLRAKTISLRGDLIVLFGGTNDYGKGVELGTLESTDNTTFYGAVKETINIIKEREPESKIIIITPLQREHLKGTRGIDENKAGYTLEEYVNALKEIGLAENIPVLDLYTDGFISINNKDENTGVLIYTQDGLHPDEEGGKILGEKIGNFIKSIYP